MRAKQKRTSSLDKNRSVFFNFRKDVGTLETHKVWHHPESLKNTFLTDSFFSAINGITSLLITNVGVFSITENSPNGRNSFSIEQHST